ncbi:MAG: hypothetical protein IJ641_09455 [Lachnospiraceae bacterium]|nr:hypothetical protein [Lachnospiraceae bacterium]
MRKKIISVILAGLLAVSGSMPAFGMSILDATINAGADRVNSTSESEADSEETETRKMSAVQFRNQL